MHDRQAKHLARSCFFYQNKIESCLELFHFADILALEQDAVFALESLLVLCSQESSVGAQNALKVRNRICSE